MKIQSGGREFNLCFMTATWSGDLEHFRWLRRSIEKAGFGDIPHIVVVQTEDCEQFRPLVRGGVQLISTADLLPGDLEHQRVQALRLTQRYGRRLSKLCVSLNKRLGWFDWVRYLGWQVQQISKLQVPAVFSYDAVVVLDSDILITRSFDLRLFLPEGRVAAFEQLYVTPQTPGLAWRWYRTACELLKQPVPMNETVNGYVGTPFVLDRVAVTGMQRWLESEYGRPWYATLLVQPVSAWSEFSMYNVFARSHNAPRHLTFTANPHSAGLDSADDARNAEGIIRAAFANPQIYFLGIPSERFARQRWSIRECEALLQDLTATQKG